jgi:hypothetical protein
MDGTTTIGSGKHREDVPFKRLPVTREPGAGAQLLSDDCAEVLERCERAMKPLKRLVRARLSESLDE